MHYRDAYRIKQAQVLISFRSLPELESDHIFWAESQRIETV